MICLYVLQAREVLQRTESKDIKGLEVLIAGVPNLWFWPLC